MVETMMVETMTVGMMLAATVWSPESWRERWSHPAEPAPVLAEVPAAPSDWNQRPARSRLSQEQLPELDRLPTGAAGTDATVR